eukprot:6193596-Pleurochrysis_carterae.AAC.2
MQQRENKHGVRKLTSVSVALIVEDAAVFRSPQSRSLPGNLTSTYQVSRLLWHTGYSHRQAPDTSSEASFGCQKPRKGIACSQILPGPTRATVRRGKAWKMKN